jgi:hypothetical protein
MDDIVTERIEDQITEGVTMESFHDVGAMCFDCFDAQIEQSGYFFARLAFRKKLRMLQPKPSDPYESITARRILAIPEKNGKTEYQVDAQNPEQIVTCVHSLFPHYGYLSCWHVKPRINQPIPM